jgi:protein gp37
MSANSKIEWTDHTHNPWIGCTKVSPACDHCYAAVSTPARALHVEWGAGQPRHRTSESNWQQPLRWNANHDKFFAEHGRRQRVFCASLADVFDKEVPVQWRIELMRLIVDTPNLDWLLLTKRIGNAAEMLETAFRAVHHQREGWADNVLPNVWIGATICNQEEADRDIPKLLQVPAAVRFLSMEPLLGPVSLRWLAAWPENAPTTAQNPYNNGVTNHLDGLRRLNWIIVGGESGHQARPMVLGWAKDIVRQCQSAGVAVHVKQLGACPTNREGEPHQISDRKGAIMTEWPEILRIREYPNG